MKEGFLQKDLSLFPFPLGGVVCLNCRPRSKPVLVTLTACFRHGVTWAVLVSATTVPESETMKTSIFPDGDISLIGRESSTEPERAAKWETRKSCEYKKK